MEAPPPAFTASVTAAPPRRIPTGVDSVLGQLGIWRAEADAQHQRKLDEVDEEVARLKTAIEDLQRQVTTLADVRTQVEDRAREIDREHARRAHHAIFTDLKSQADSLDQRARIASHCETERIKALNAALEASALKAIAEEHRQFRMGAAALSALPPSYRAAIEAHHQAQEVALREFIAKNDPGPVPLTVPTMPVDIVFTVDATEDQPELISVVLPVRESAWQRWEDHPDDLQVQLATRVVEGLYRASVSLGLTRAHALSGGHRGLLAVELELGRERTSDTGERVAAAIRDAISGAPELTAARMSARVHRVPTEYLLPPEGEGSAEPGEADHDA